MNKINGFINIYKNEGINSFAVIAKLKKILFPYFDKCKIGHTGTLDPLACGVLPIAIGEATKVISFMDKDTKSYIFTIKFGAETETDDREGKIINKTTYIPKLKDVKNILQEFTGKINQVPPKYSAIKINGVRAYKLARNNKNFEIKARENFIHNIEIIKVENDYEITMTATVNRGFYIRSLGRDIARKLGSLGYITFLERIRSGNFTKENSITLDKLENICKNEPNLDARSLEASGILQDISYGLNGISVIRLNKKQNTDIKFGQVVSIDESLEKQLEGLKSSNGTLYQTEFNSQISSIVKYENGILQPLRVFNL